MQTQAYNLPYQLWRVLDCARRGLGEKETAKELNLEPGTVKQYRHRLRFIFMARNMAQCIDRAYEQGYLVVERNALKCVGIFLISTLLFGMEQEARTVRVLRGNTPIVRTIRSYV